eukprot:3941657-Rhodomonas_salina.1
MSVKVNPGCAAVAETPAEANLALSSCVKSKLARFVLQYAPNGSYLRDVQSRSARSSRRNLPSGPGRPKKPAMLETFTTLPRALWRSTKSRDVRMKCPRCPVANCISQPLLYRVSGSPITAALLNKMCSLSYFAWILAANACILAGSARSTSSRMTSPFNPRFLTLRRASSPRSFDLHAIMTVYPARANALESNSGIINLRFSFRLQTGTATTPKILTLGCFTHVVVVNPNPAFAPVTMTNFPAPSGIRSMPNAVF